MVTYGGRMNRIAFVTIGQTPRVDLVPEIRAAIGSPVDVVERGALDGLTATEIAALAPSASQQRLVTRLADGGQAIVAKELIHGRLQVIFDELAREGIFCTVLLCTGLFPPFRVPNLFLEAQAIVDAAVAAIAAHAPAIGLMVPLKEQIAEFHFSPAANQRLIVSHASPYEPGRLEDAARELAGADLIVMHCMGYTEAMREVVARESGRPVLLARRLVAAAIAQLV